MLGAQNMVIKQAKIKSRVVIYDISQVSVEILLN